MIATDTDRGRKSAKNGRNGSAGANCNAPGNRYVDARGRVLFVSSGLGTASCATFHRKPNGSLERVVSKHMPLQPSFEAAQKDLDDYARLRSLRTYQDPPAESLPSAMLQPERPKSPNGARPAAGPEPSAEKVHLIPIDRIDTSPYQTREAFDEAELADLADSLKTQGLLQPVLVRPKLHRYELVAGERRLRAAMRAKWTQIPAIVRRLNDRQAAEATAAENLQRKNLNAIEEAKAYEMLLGAEDGPTQAELAQRLKISQPVISNALRLLDLPAKPWQAWIISGEMSPTHARAILPIAKSPKLLASLAEVVARWLKEDGELVPIEAFKDDIAHGFLGQHAGQLAGRWWSQRLGQFLPALKLSDEQRAEAELVDFAGETWAGNRAVIDQAWAAEEDRLLAKREKKEQAAANGKAAAGSKADRSAIEARERSAEQRARRRREIRTDWLRLLMAREIRSNRMTASGLDRLLLVAATEWSGKNSGGWYQNLESTLTDRVQAGGEYLDGTLWAMVAALEESDLSDVLETFSAGLFWDAHEDRPEPCVPAEAVEAAARYFRVNLEEAWTAEKLGPLTEAWLNAHNLDELRAMAEHANVMARAGCGKKELVGEVAAASFPLPKELAFEEEDDEPAQKARKTKKGKAKR